MFHGLSIYIAKWTLLDKKFSNSNYFRIMWIEVLSAKPPPVAPRRLNDLFIDG